MRTLLYLIAFLWMAFGAYLIIFTEKARNTAKKIFETQKMKRLAVLPFVFGLLLMIGAFFNPDIFWFTFILGLLAIAKGLFFYLAPIERSKVHIPLDLGHSFRSIPATHSA